MIKKVKVLLSALAISSMVVASGPFVGTSNTTAAAVVECTKTNVLGFPGWYNGLKCDKADNGAMTAQINNSADFWKIGMNILQWLILAAGYVALYFIIISGFNYITAAGDTQKVMNAKKALTNAIVGLIIALVSVAIVRTIQGAIL